VDWNNFREKLIESLSTPEIGVFFNRNYFEQVITPGQNENLFTMMRDGLFYETGINYRPFRIYFDDSLPYHVYYFTINSFTSIPSAGFDDPSDLLVNDIPDRLALLGINGREANNPANDKKAGIINRKDKEVAENAGLITWDATGYFILGFSRFLREHGYLCVEKKYTEDALTKLKTFYPETVDLIERANMLSICVKIFRLLAKEEISIRNLRTILEAVIESDYIIADGNSILFLMKEYRCMP
jgi:type III secretion protein V